MFQSLMVCGYCCLFILPELKKKSFTGIHKIYISRELGWVRRGGGGAIYKLHVFVNILVRYEVPINVPNADTRSSSADVF